MSRKGQNVLHRIKCPEKDNYVPQRTILYQEGQKCPAENKMSRPGQNIHGVTIMS